MDEAYVFVCYDSRANRARFTPHTGEAACFKCLREHLCSAIYMPCTLWQLFSPDKSVFGNQKTPQDLMWKVHARAGKSVSELLPQGTCICCAKLCVHLVKLFLQCFKARGWTDTDAEVECSNAGFVDINTSPNAPARESVELRSYCFWEDLEPQEPAMQL